ncbi:metallopeptidase TldD-related protein [Rhodococcus antarcticus]|uniref:Metallopeptidase TldD-related protein n=1 Tax=Rhodococcus antarcticus TaxID=2987751 RepID=A0ABY6P4A9_9NOCA|nr:metallopeptidase TldD-related protein [Rhodococcus antarcticus]UZJ26329.1 metallopeptidase TldD-related protein [Rhodococcus antarcticus]
MIPAQDLVESALSQSSADGCVVLVTDASEASLRWANSTMTTNGVSTSRSWAVVSVLGTSVGVVTSTSVDPAEVTAVVRASEEAARAAGPARDAAPLVTGGAEEAGWDGAAAQTDVTVFDTLATELAAGFRGQDVLYGFAEHQLHTTWLGSSTGLRRRFTQPTGSVEVNAKRDGSSAWGGVSTRDFTDVDLPSILADLSTRLGWGRTQVELPAGRYETLLPPSAAADLMIYLAWSMEGRGAQEGHTALSRAGGTRIGEKLTDLPLTLAFDPHAPGLEYAPFVATTHSDDSTSVFDNGLAAERVELVRDGVVNALTYPRAAATEFGAPVAVPGDNLLLTGGSGATIGDMVASTERGLLLTCLWYIREVDPATLLVTGLTRDGVYLVEDGKVIGEVNNFRFNESPLDLLRRVTEVGATERTLAREWKDWFTRTAVGPMRIPDFHMSSTSRAR